MKKTRHVRKHSFRKRKTYVIAAVLAIAIGLLGYAAIQISGAATYATNKEAETATIAGKAIATGQTGASGGSAIKFGAAAVCGSPTVPVGSRQVFLGDFSTGNFSQWGNVQTNGYNGSGSGIGGGNSRISIVRGDCYGKNVAKYTVQPGDSMAGGERSEVANCGGACVYEGNERWYEFSTKFPTDFPTPRGNWFIIMQWHSASGSPPLAIEVNRSGIIEVRNNRPEMNQVHQVAPIVRGEYMHFVLHTKFSNNKSVGFVRMFVNGVEKLPRTAFRNMNDGENYLKTGIYRGSANQNPTQTIYSTGVRVTAP